MGLAFGSLMMKGRFVITDHGDFVLFNVYFPNGSQTEQRHLFKQEFLKRLLHHLKRQLAPGGAS